VVASVSKGRHINKRKANTCPVVWNRGVRPFKTRCANTTGHKGQHRDKDGFIMGADQEGSKP